VTVVALRDEVAAAADAAACEADRVIKLETLIEVEVGALPCRSSYSIKQVLEG